MCIAKVVGDDPPLADCAPGYGDRFEGANGLALECHSLTNLGYEDSDLFILK